MPFFQKIALFNLYVGDDSFVQEPYIVLILLLSGLRTHTAGLQSRLKLIYDPRFLWRMPQLHFSLLQTPLPSTNTYLLPRTSEMHLMRLKLSRGHLPLSPP